MDKMIDISNLIRCETEAMPMACSELEFDFLIPHLEDYVKSLFKVYHLDYLINDIKIVNKISFTYPEIKFFVISLQYPFEMTNRFIGCLSRVHFVYSNKSKKIYYFGEVLTDRAIYGTSKMRLRYYFAENNSILSYDVMPNIPKNINELAEQLPFYIYNIETKGVGGQLVTKNEVDKIIRDYYQGFNKIDDI